MNIDANTLATIGTYISYAISAAAAAAVVLPQPKPGTIWATLRTVVDFLAMNFGNAKNTPKA
jgi:hypothetical protein